MAAQTEAESTPILAWSSTGLSSKASMAMNSAIVKPIPPKRPTPAGRRVRPSATASAVKSVIPTGLPKHVRVDRKGEAGGAWW
jgi:hypothetical protein